MAIQEDDRMKKCRELAKQAYDGCMEDIDDKEICKEIYKEVFLDCWIGKRSSDPKKQ